MSNVCIEEFDASSLVHPINLMLGENIVGVELGTSCGASAVGLVQNCPNIQKLYTIDKYEPYVDYIKSSISFETFVVDEMRSETTKFYAKMNVKYSGHESKIDLLYEDTEESLKRFGDDYFDFIFFDAHLNQEQLYRDLNSWYSKCKTGGLICVDDWDCLYVQNAVNLFRYDNSIKSNISFFNDSIIWVKR